MAEYKKKSFDKDSILNDPTARYGSGSFYKLSVRGISKNYIKQVLLLSQLTILELIKIIPISIDTYKRKSDFNPPVTEKILEIERELLYRGPFHVKQNNKNTMRKTQILQTMDTNLR